MILRALEKAADVQGILTFEAFMETALYHPRAGYYTKTRKRIGRDPQTDFYTATSMGATFPKLVVSAITQLLGEPLEEFAFVEAGPETESGILGELDNCPFEAVHLIRPGDSFEIPEKSIVFSNELFDAQPFRRLIFTRGRWHEMCVQLEDTRFTWTERVLAKPVPGLPESASEGYMIDWPGRANSLLDSIARQRWKGLFIAFDYGLDSPVIFNERPQGTGRTYSNHKLGSNLLDRPGEVDITCHVIWDIMENILRSHRFTDIGLLRQEAFFMKFAQSGIEQILLSAPAGFSHEKQSLMQLLHPSNMGHQFQVLSARRMEY